MNHVTAALLGFNGKEDDWIDESRAEETYSSLLASGFKETNAYGNSAHMCTVLTRVRGIQPLTATSQIIV